MRMLALPAALALAFVLYLPLPQAFEALFAALGRLHALLLSRFAQKRGDSGAKPTLALFLLLLGGISALLGAIHPAVCALTMMPLFGALALVPRAATVKRELDSGSLVGDMPAYEALVRKTCSDFAPAFVTDACLPLLLCALGMVLHLGGALGWMALGLRAAKCSGVSEQDSAEEHDSAAEQVDPLAAHILPPLERAATAILHGLMLFCSYLVGRSPFRTQGSDITSRLLSILGIAQGDASGHAPVSGDITQAAFLCCFCTSLLCLLLTLAGLPLA